MTETFIRLSLFSVYPLLLGFLAIISDQTSSRLRKREIMVVYFLAIAIAGGGISNFIAHFFLSDLVAASIGWPAGNPFQLEVAFANLIIGILGFIAVNRNDGFREATVVAVTVFSIGATVVHLMDIIKTGNLSPGNTYQNILNLVKPALLITLLKLYRQAEKAESSEKTDTKDYIRWRKTFSVSAGLATLISSSSFAVGFFSRSPILSTFIGSIIGALTVFLVIRFSRDK